MEYKTSFPFPEARVVFERTYSGDLLVEDGVVLESSIFNYCFNNNTHEKNHIIIAEAEKLIKKIKKEVCFNKLNDIHLSIFIAENHPEIYSKKDIRVLIRLELERIKKDVRILLNNPESFGFCEVTETGLGYDLTLSDPDLFFKKTRNDSLGIKKVKTVISELEKKLALFIEENKSNKKYSA